MHGGALALGRVDSVSWMQPLLGGATLQGGFVDINLPNTPVFTAMHGEGTWSPWEIAPSLEAFATVLHGAQALASGRDSPVALESNPLTDHEREAFRALVEANGATWDYWLAMFQDLGSDH
jgi:hypothetical protein